MAKKKPTTWVYSLPTPPKVAVPDDFNFCSTYACPGPNAISPSFESKFARMEYVGNSRFNLSFLRHTGKWVELFTGLTLDECLKAVREDPWFVP